ncbi:MAG: SHOCT domain-containing protein, partial [Armatimonadota bacterium]|nr:SHOCT domain-containing protein [Armatimonadota bacterium]
ALKAEMDRYIERMDSLRLRFDKAERHAVQEPVDVNGEVLFNPGRRETDPATGADRYVGGDIDERYAFYVGNAQDPANPVVNNLAADILRGLGTQNDIWGIRDGELPRISQVILDHTQAVFQPVAEESVLDKFFDKYRLDTDRTVQTLRRVAGLSQPFLHLQENAPNYTHNINKEQTIVGVLHGAAPRTESEQRFQTMITETVQGVKEQQISNSNESHQVLFLRERAAFPLRLLQGMESYRYAYDQVKAQGAAANPIHTRTDIREWIRISPPSFEDQKAAWRAFVVGWASGVVAEERESRYTSVGTREQVRFVANYTDRFGMPKSDVLGIFNSIESPIAGFKTEADSADRPPAEARDIIQRLCDDRRMEAQIVQAIDERLRMDGPSLLGARLVQHANAQKATLTPAFYNAYYRVLTQYLEEINFAGAQSAAPALTSAAPVAAPPAIVGTPNGVSAPARTRKERLAELKELLDDGLITQEEHDSRRREIVAEV